MSTSTYKLTYFDAKGRAEIARFIFAQAEVKYEDVRLTYNGEEWAKLKPSTPTGMLPMLEVDGKPLAGSGPINRYLAEKFNLAGGNDFDNAKVAAIIDVVNDLLGKLVAFYFEKDEDRKPKLKKELEDVHFPKYWSTLEKMIQKDGADGWSFGSSPTYADFAIYCCVDYTKIMFPDILEKYPVIGKNVASVKALPNIAKWLETRPKTQY